MNAQSHQLKKMLHHHQNHTIGRGQSLPFLNIYVADDQFLQLAYGVVGTVFGVEDDTKQVIEAYLNDREDLTFEGELGWKLPGGDDWSAELAYRIITDILALVDHEVKDITHVAELDCPNGGTVTWDDLDGGVEPTDHKSVDDPEARLLAVYKHLQQVEKDVGGVPDPFPIVRLFSQDEELAYSFGPAVHSLDTDSTEAREAFMAEISRHDDLVVAHEDTTSISVSHYGWTPDSAFEVSKRMLQDVHNLSLKDITYVEITNSGPNEAISWTDV
ncbi:hypothetical protein [Haladaptatus sp. YSMS36]|uniref:hypothetical protein n=1 Tax=Haladaptatus sp. YSMS36 TaxID=3033384 RepID=UPI0023E757AD|nr:hypothetical protein [Haladaptatus sp. YSMS36]